MTTPNIGKYRIVRALGKGAMGAVYECVHDAVERRFAVKVLHPQFVTNPELVARFFNEARAANRIGHPGMAEVFDCERLADGTSYIVMEYLEGKTLRQHLFEQRQGLHPARVARLAWYIADTLTAAHAKNIIHRDLKPDNIMLIRDPQAPDGERPKLLDFGIAKLVTAEPKEEFATEHNTFMGTPAYMSPEQCRDAASVDEKADVYSCGVTIYQLLAGRLPFPSAITAELFAMHLFQMPPSLKELVAAAPEPLCALVHAMLAKDKQQRPTMKQVTEELALLIAQEPAAPDSFVSAPSLTERPTSTSHPSVPSYPPRAAERSNPSSHPSVPSHPPRAAERSSPSSHPSVPSHPPRAAERSTSTSHPSVPSHPPRAAERPSPSSPPSFSSSTPPLQHSTLEKFSGQRNLIVAPTSKWVLGIGLLLGVSASLTTFVVLVPWRSSARVPHDPAAPVKAAPVTGAALKQVRWNLTSEPASAEVLRATDRSLLGTTPYVRAVPAAAANETLVVHAAGYVDRLITLDRNSDVTLHVRLQRRAATGPRNPLKRKRQDDQAPLPIMP